MRLPPGGGPLRAADGWSVLRVRDPGRLLREGLRERLGAEVVTLHASGREALRAALVHLSKQSGRSEIVVPAYTCFSVPASVVAAGLRVRLVDVTLEGGIDPDDLARQPLERSAAVIVSNLLGVPEPIAALLPPLRAAGVAVVDDAAQSLGARSPEGAAGARGDVGLLSFGRGKPFAALGGGGLAWARRSDALEAPPTPSPRPELALLRAAGYRLALDPYFFRLLSAIPALGIGETRFDPGFRRGGIDGASLCLAATLLPRLDVEIRKRSERAGHLARGLREETRFAPLLPLAGSSGAFPRLGVLAPSEQIRDAALAELRPFGVTRLYPSPLDRIEALRPHLEGEARFPGASEFAARLLTLPAHDGLHETEIREIQRTLRRLS